jgi:hypothetical protein
MLEKFMDFMCSVCNKHDNEISDIPCDYCPFNSQENLKQLIKEIMEED